MGTVKILPATPSSSVSGTLSGQHRTCTSVHPKTNNSSVHLQISFSVLPILFPAFMCLAIIKLSIASRNSRSRVELLEAEDASTTQRLVHIFGRLEREVEDLVVDIVDDPNTPIPLQESTKTPKKSPRINAAQKKMAAVLNALPQLKKERAYISGVRNSHAVIVARDVDSLEFHKIGEGVLRHWADAFVM